MQLLDWTLLDAFQAGALAALALAYGADGLVRRDRMMGWMALGCILLAARHALVPIWGAGGVSGPVERAEILLVSFGFLALCAAIVHLFPRQLPGRFPGWVALGLLPNAIRAFLLPVGHPLDSVLSHVADLTYLVGCGFLIRAALQARLLGDPMGGRFFAGFLAASFPVVVEITAASFFNLKLHLTGFSLLLLAIALGASWQRLATQSLRDRVLETEVEAEAWRNLLPGTTFRTDRPSPFMETTFGPDWAVRLRQEAPEHLLALDGTPYRFQVLPLPDRHLMGWAEREDDSHPGLGGFLAGWTVALGMEAAEAVRLEGWLRAWGADVEIWSTVPPREGPYPSVLIWAREPSILAVWREDDLLRRRARWIQVGGPQTDGPHARLDPPVTEPGLRTALEELLGRVQEH